MKLNLHDRKIWIDIINMGIGMAIIVIAIIALQGGDSDRALFNMVYLLGFIMFLLNAIRSAKSSRLLTAVFLLFAAMLAAALIISVHGL